MTVEVRDNQIEPALKALKTLMVKTGLFQEMKRREHDEKLRQAEAGSGQEEILQGDEAGPASSATMSADAAIVHRQRAENSRPICLEANG